MWQISLIPEPFEASLKTSSDVTADCREIVMSSVEISPENFLDLKKRSGLEYQTDLRVRESLRKLDRAWFRA